MSKPKNFPAFISLILKPGWDKTLQHHRADARSNACRFDGLFSINKPECQTYRPNTPSAAPATFSAVSPNFSYSSSYGAEAPK